MEPIRNMLHHSAGPEGGGIPEMPPLEWEQNFYSRVKDLIDTYKPDLMYFDGNYPFPHDDGEVGRRLVAHYYNANAKWHNGNNQAAMCIKRSRPETCVLDIERGKSKSIAKYPWQTDTCIGGWYYRVGIKYKTVPDIIRMLIDIVSKNGNLLLNIPLHPNGSIDEEEEAILEGLGEWMSVNESGIYETRPWVVYGEGPSMAKEKSTNRFGGMKDVESFEPGDLRFARKGDNELYAFLMAWPEKKKITIKSLASHKADQIQIDSVTMLGVIEPLDYISTNEGLVISLPETTPCQHAWTLCIRGKGLILDVESLTKGRF
jgi:alpha-L-fucosidase